MFFQHLAFITVGVRLNFSSRKPSGRRTLNGAVVEQASCCSIQSLWYGQETAPPSCGLVVQGVPVIGLLPIQWICDKCFWLQYSFKLLFTIQDNILKFTYRINHSRLTSFKNTLHHSSLTCAELPPFFTVKSYSHNWQHNFNR